MLNSHVNLVLLLVLMFWSASLYMCHFLLFGLSHINFEWVLIQYAHSAPSNLGIFLFWKNSQHGRIRWAPNKQDWNIQNKHSRRKDYKAYKNLGWKWLAWSSSKISNFCHTEGCRTKNWGAISPEVHCCHQILSRYVVLHRVMVRDVAWWWVVSSWGYSERLWHGPSWSLYVEISHYYNANMLYISKSVFFSTFKVYSKSGLFNF